MVNLIQYMIVTLINQKTWALFNHLFEMSMSYCYYRLETNSGQGHQFAYKKRICRCIGHLWTIKVNSILCCDNECHTLIGYNNLLTRLAKPKQKKEKFNPLISEIWLLILLSCCYTPPCKLIMRIWCYIKIKILPDKFEYTHYLFAG